VSELVIALLLGALIGAFIAWAVTTWRLSREPHCLDCECEGCRIVRGQQA